MRKQLIGILLMVALFFVWTGLVLILGYDWMSLAPLVFVLATFLVGFFHPNWDLSFVVFAAIPTIGGFMFSLIGTQTGGLFGQYFYGRNMGILFFETPLSIGLLWLLLCYCSSVVVAQLGQRSSVLNNDVVKALSASFIILLFDVLLEKIAASADFWYFKNQEAPLQNYTAWFLLTAAFNFVFARLGVQYANPLAKWFLICFGLFLLSVSILPMYFIG